MATANFPSRPNQGGFIMTFPHLKVLEGPRQFKTLQQFEVSGDIDGRDHVMASPLLPIGFKSGQFKPKAKFAILLDEYTDWVSANPNFLWKTFDLTGRFVSGPRSFKVQVSSFLVMSMPTLAAEGTDEVKMEFDGLCLDILLNGKSVVPQPEEEPTENGT